MVGEGPRRGRRGSGGDAVSRWGAGWSWRNRAEDAESGKRKCGIALMAGWLGEGPRRGRRGSGGKAVLRWGAGWSWRDRAEDAEVVAGMQYHGGELDGRGGTARRTQSLGRGSAVLR
ncbi:hypothetical protein B4O97_07485 [Marispirochaeta aestuarii]|uniref:Uncharacterized protein n=1 Tax=Marispirochaeta aestuarii TaxID=1963862 RepID=A0A1Y1S0K3_9SPIO|nr:hypothetical protein B4O97_07485 [Marispirochaeta aestuarii]